MRPGASFLQAVALTAGLANAAQAGGRITERVAPYAIEGTTGAALYASIGERGPQVDGRGRTIAHTTYTLTWRRDYRRDGDGCVLASAVPNLVITYTLPKPAERLPADMQPSWDRFIAGIRRHEENHGLFVKDAVARIEAETVGLRVAGDADCRKTRAAVQERLVPIAESLRLRHRAFDAVEMSDGGAVQSLILSLVNGPRDRARADRRDGYQGRATFDSTPPH